MSSNIGVTTYPFIHEAGTKFYELLLVFNRNTGETAVVSRWGKIKQLKVGGQIGEFKYFKSRHEAEVEITKAKSKRESRGYRLQSEHFGFEETYPLKKLDMTGVANEGGKFFANFAGMTPATWASFGSEDSLEEEVPKEMKTVEVTVKKPVKISEEDRQASIRRSAIRGSW